MRCGSCDISVITKFDEKFVEHAVLTYFHELKVADAVHGRGPLPV